MGPLVGPVVDPVDRSQQILSIDVGSVVGSVEGANAGNHLLRCLLEENV